MSPVRLARPERRGNFAAARTVQGGVDPDTNTHAPAQAAANGGFHMRISILQVVAIVAALAAPTIAQAQDFKDSVLSAHNALRAKHGVPPLSWSDSLAKEAQGWSDKCVFEHSNMSHGENLAQGSTGGYSPAEYVNDWYSEISSYDFTTGDSTDGNAVGHFTQVVWKSTTKVGCGFSTCGDNDLLVCNYSPAGNFAGQYLENVPPAK